MSRSKWKNYYVDNKSIQFISMIDRLKAEKHENIESKFIHKTTVRSSTIMPTFEKIDCMLYNGIIWKKIKITSNMFYNKMGSFNYTRKLPKHKDKNKKL